MEFAVTGHARCGTTYMSMLFRAYGYDVRHEQSGEHGTSCWCWAAPPGPVPYGPPRPEARPKHLIQVVREPWAVISSCVTLHVTENKTTLDFMRQHIDIPLAPPLTMAVLMLCRWQELINRQVPDLTVRVEHAPANLARYLVSRGYEIGDGALPPTDVNTRNQSLELDHCNVSKLPGHARLELDRYCDRYGYLPIRG